MPIGGRESNLLPKRTDRELLGRHMANSVDTHLLIRIVGISDFFEQVVKVVG